MVHKSFIERKKLAEKAKGKASSEVLDTPRLDSGSANDAIESEGLAPKRVYKKHGSVPAAVAVAEEEIEPDKEPRAEPKKPKKQPKVVVDDDTQFIDELNFENGNNTISIKFLKKKHRMYCIKFYLNEDCEIRPGTYAGSYTAKAFWSLLKGAMVK
jgi:hypothetical protein